MHRIHWFDQRIRAGRHPNSGHISNQFEISKRQAQRDIEYMEISLHAPLMYVAKHRGYCYKDKTYVLPHIYVTEDEQKVLKYLAHRYRQYNYENGETITRVAHLLDRFTDAHETELQRNLPTFEMNPRLIQNLDLLSHGIQHSLVIQIIYKDQEGEKQFRICPLQLVSRYNADYVVAYCEDQGRQRTLRLDGILFASVTTDGFERTTDMETIKWDGQIPVRKPFIAKICFLSPLQGDSWNGYRIMSNHELLYEIEFYDTNSFLQHLLVTEWKELLSPQWLKKKLQSRCQETLARMHIER